MTTAAQHEISTKSLVRDTRSFESRFGYWLFQPNNLLKVVAGLVVGEVIYPALTFLWLGCIALLYILLSDRRFRLPLRMPKDRGGLDHSDVEERREEVREWGGLIKKTVTIRKSQPSGGIYYFGYQRSLDTWQQGMECWATNSDVRTHMALAGTTGSGKTRFLMALCYNALCYGSGYIFADGKAVTDLPYESWCMLRYFGREDDALVLSFLTGGRDPFEDLLNHGGARDEQHSGGQTNTYSPTADGEPSFILQLLASMLPKASGDGAQWQMKAVNLVDAVTRVLCYKRATGELDTSIPTIREYLALDNLVKLYIEGRDGNLPELAWLPIKAYFETALPGFVPALADQPDQWNVEVRNQHGYLTGQFARMLSMMTDAYGHVFNERLAEIDPEDVVINNRALLVLIPSMGKSEEEASALGKLFVSGVRLMMARNLGYKIEGLKREVIDTKATNTPFPLPIITDELGYYYARGMAVLYAQARQLNCWMVAAFQDLQALKRGEGADEIASLLANTKFKFCLALEDPEATFDLFRKAGGQAAVSVVAGHDASSGVMSTTYTSQSNTRVELRDRVDVLELKEYQAGQGMVIFKDKVVRFQSFYVPSEFTTSDTIPARINRFLQVPRPSYERLPEFVVADEKAARSARGAEREIAGALFKRQPPYFPKLDDPILDAVVAAAKHMDSLGHQNFSAHDRAIVLYEAAVRKLREVRTNGSDGFWHKAIAPSASMDDDEYEEVEI